MAISLKNILSQTNSSTSVLVADSQVDIQNLGNSANVEMHDSANGIINAQLSVLKLYKVTEQEYKDTISTHTYSELSNSLFDVAYDQVDAMNQPVKNVGTPVVDSDAATKAYVDSKVPT